MAHEFSDHVLLVSIFRPQFTIFWRFFHNYRDVAIILSTTNFWPNRTAEDITVEEYTGLINSHVLSNISSQLKNCSLENELNAAAGGTGLAFIVMADVFTKLPGSPFWSLLFFAMLLSLGLGSQIGILEGMVSTLFDMPQLKSIRKPLLTGTAWFYVKSILRNLEVPKNCHFCSFKGS